MNQTMMLIRSAWQSMQTFRLMPTSNDCPYVEAVYNPEFKTLIVIAKHKQDTYQFVPKIDDDGYKIPIKGKKDTYKQQRVIWAMPTEFLLIDEKEQLLFIKKFAENEADFDYKQFLNAEMKFESTDPALGKSEGGGSIKTLEQLQKES